MLVEQRGAPRTQREYVNVDDAEQCRYWCELLVCTEQQLREGVRAVGSMVEDLRRHLGKYVRIDTMDQRRELCRRLRCTESELLEAVVAVGSMAVDVRRHLLHRKPVVQNH